MRNRGGSSQFGILGVILTFAFWVYVVYVDSGLGPNAFTQSPYVLYVLLPGTLIAASLLSIVAALKGSKWWLVALIGPTSGALLLLTAGR